MHGASALGSVHWLTPLLAALPAPHSSCRPPGYANAVLTPNKVEFGRLADKLGVAADSPEALQSICRRWAARGQGRPGSAGQCDSWATGMFIVRESSQAAQRLPCSAHCRSLEGPVVVRKGRADAVGDGRQVVTCDEEGSPRRAGGQVGGRPDRLWPPHAGCTAVRG